MVNNNRLSPKELGLIDLARENEVLQNHLLHNINDTKWFWALKEEGYFNHDKAPGPIPTDTEGLFTIPEWNVLAYLEKVSKVCDRPENREIAFELVKIILNVTNYKDASGYPKDNYRTWWYFSKILVNLNSIDIPNDLIGNISNWYISKFNTDMATRVLSSKLLPKLLQKDNDNLTKAELLVDVLTEYKRNEANLERLEYRCVADPYWLLDAFINKNIARDVGSLCSANLVIKLADKLKILFRLQYPVERYFQSNEKPFKKCKLVFFQFKDYEYQIKLESFAGGEELEFTDILFKSEVKWQEIYKSEISICKSLSDLEKIIELELENIRIKKDIGLSIPKEDISNIYEASWVDYSSIWIPSLAAWDGKHINRADEVIIAILLNILLSMAKVDHNKAIEIFELFRGSNYRYPIFRRIIIFIIDKLYDSFQYWFEKYFNEIAEGSLLDDPNGRNELFSLLKNNAMKFSQLFKKGLKKNILKGPTDIKKSENSKKRISYWRQRWYFALKELPEFNLLYENEKSITGEEVEMELGTTHTRIGPGPSPLSIENILNISNKEIAGFLREFRTKDHWKGPTIDGLGEVLKNSVMERPSKFTSDLSQFINSKYFYVYNILLGLLEAYKAKNDIDWDPVIDFMSSYINRPQFWSGVFLMKEDDEWYGTHHWVIGMCADIIEQIAIDKIRRPTEHNIEKAKKLIYSITGKCKSEPKLSNDNPVSVTLNSSYGKILGVFIQLVYRRINLSEDIKRSNKVLWLNDEKDFFDKQFSGNFIEPYVLFGRYLTTFFYFNSEWTRGKIVEFLDIRDLAIWSSFMYGYLSGGRVSTDNYISMRDHYLKTFTNYIMYENTDELLVQHIFFGYLHQLDEPGDNNLYALLLSEWNSKKIVVLIDLLWELKRDYKENKISDKEDQVVRIATELWNFAYNKYSEIERENMNENDYAIISELLRLSIYLPELNDYNVRLLMFSAPYANIGHNDHFLLEYISNLKDKGDPKETAMRIALILRNMTDGFLVEYMDKEFRNLIEFIFSSQNSKAIDTASDICNTYLEKNSYILKDIYDKYNPV